MIGHDWIQYWRRLLALPLALLLLTGAGQCSIGGRDFGGGGSADSTRTTVAPIATFGSIVAGATEHATTSAAITLDGVNVSESKLHPGQTVTIVGTVRADGLTGAATSASVSNKLIGPVSATDPGSGSFTVLGQTVYVTADTSVGSGFTVPDAAGFAVGTTLVIDGYRTSTGFVAARIDLLTAGQALRVAGRVTNLDGFAQRFSLGGTTVDFSAVAGGLPPLLTNGSYALASGGTASSATTLRAAAIALATESPAGASGDDGLVHGAVTRFASSGDFDVAGQAVATTGLTTVTNGALTDVALDRELEVTGQYSAAGVLTATRIDFVPSVPFRIVGPVHALNTSGATLEIAGVTLSTDRRTRWDDQGVLGLKVFGLAQLQIGDWVEVRGLASGKLAASARLLERRVQPTPAYVELQDVPSVLTDPSLTLSGIAVDTRTALFTDAAGQPLSHSAFYAQATGRVVRVTGAFIGDTLTATTVQLRPL